eukprot:gene2880-3146_t
MEASDDFGNEVQAVSMDLLPKQAEAVIRMKKEQMEREGKCSHCFLFLPYCLCRATAEIFGPLRQQSLLRTHLHLYMHYKEWGRSSNTGKLMQVGLLDKLCTTTIYGLEEEEQRLEESLLCRPSIILYPRGDSLPISSLREWYEQHGGDVQVVVIDSTWPQSHAMDRRLPSSIPRVRIDEMVSGPSGFLNRKQSINQSKVSTIESVSMALRALGATEEALQPFQQALHYGVDAVLRQAGRKPVYGNVIVPQQVREVAGNYMRPTIVKPTRCPHCERTVQKNGVNFRNVGVRRKRRSSEGGEDEEERVYRVWKCTGCEQFFFCELNEGGEAETGALSKGRVE